MPARPSVVVAEDDRYIRELIRTHLTVAGYDVHVAQDGLEAVDLVRRLRPDAMVLDLNMPELDGFGVIEQLTEGSGPIRMPVMVLTARHCAGDVRRAIQLGVRDFLAKPFNEVQLTSRLIRLLHYSPTIAA